VHFFEIPKCHQGVARNVGVQHATGERVLFIGDDILLAPDACEKHCPHPCLSGRQALPLSYEERGESRSGAILGFTTWDPAVGITPVMRWLETSGWQFGYPSIARYVHEVIPPAVQHQYSYTSHISLPLSIAKKIPFRTDVHLYGWEDIEWGMRLRDAGVQLVYESDARALHHHHMTLENSLKRMETLGRSAVEIQKKVPEFDRAPKGWRLLAYRILSLLPTMSGKHRKAFLRGLIA
jgi:glycosyltransferase involved in cell wall biosynthesis